MSRELSPSPLPRQTRRLLEALAHDHACAKENELRPGFLAVAAPRGKITTVLASLPLSAAQPLVEGGFVRWCDASLSITPEGRALLRRLATPAGEDAFASQHRETIREVRDPGEKPVTVDANESPLAWLARRRDRDGKPFLDAAAIEAGERFRRDVTIAQLLPSVTSNWSAQGTGRGDPTRALLPSEVAIAGRQRVDRALDALGPDFAGLILDACGFVKKLETIEGERGWPPRAGKVVLRLALGQLARHYGLAASASGPAASRGVQHWGTADYRPKISSLP